MRFSMNKTVVFAYHDIGCIGIETLLAADYSIEAVFTHADDPKENRFFGSVAQLCAERNIPVYAPENVNDSRWITLIRDLQPKYIFSFYYRNLLVEELLAIAPGGAFNLHGSLLPRYRGRAPVNWVLVNGESETGVTLHRMVKRADAGAILAQDVISIAYEDTAFTLHSKLRDAARKLLVETLPRLAKGEIVETSQDEKLASKFGRRTPSDGEINWEHAAPQIYNLVRAVTLPYPGAFSFVGEYKLIIWSARVVEQQNKQEPGTVLSLDPLQITCGEGILEIISGQQRDDGLILSGSQLAREMDLYEGVRLRSRSYRKVQHPILVLILGVNGFIGHHLSERLLLNDNYEVYGLDTSSDRVVNLKKHTNFHFVEADLSIHAECVEYYIKKCDVILPVKDISTPVKDSPLQVFELIFEENLKIVRYCVKYNKRLIFPSSSLVYGLCDDQQLDENTSSLIVGPIDKQCWMHSASQQLLDRVIWAYGQKGLQFTLFRPFNWIGSYPERLDSTYADSSRTINQLLRNLVEGAKIKLINGGIQKCCFTDVSDGAEALLQIIENKNKRCDGQIINIGNPHNEISIRELAEELLRQFEVHPFRSHFPVFAGFLDVERNNFCAENDLNFSHGKPSIANARRLLSWSPKISLSETIGKILNQCLQESVNDLIRNDNKV